MTSDLPTLFALYQRVWDYVLPLLCVVALVELAYQTVRR